MPKSKSGPGTSRAKAKTDASEQASIDGANAASRSKLERFAWHIAIIPVLWAFGYTAMRGSDLWWHIATGRWIVDHGTIPRIDEWSFSAAGRPWLQHEWLSDLLFQWWVAPWGVGSLVYWKWLVIILTFGLLFHTAVRITRDPVSSFAGVLLAVATAAPFMDIRPHLYSYLGTVLVIHLVLDRRQPPVYLPLIFLVWANMHGGFFFGLMALFILLAPAAFYGDRAFRIRAGLTWLASALVCLINPNGIEAFAYPLKYAFDRGSMFSKVIEEWAPPFTPGGIQSPLYPYCIAVFVIAALYILTKPALRKQSWSILALGALTLAMSLTSRRFILVFAIAQSLVTARALSAVLAPYIKRVPSMAAAAAVAVLGIFLLYSYPLTTKAFHYLAVEDEFPIEVCNFIDANSLSGNVFALYNWGGYLHYRTNGRMKVYMDGRADTVYDNQILQQYAHVQAFRPGWEEVIERSGAQYVLWPRNEQSRPMAQLMTKGQWRILYDDFVSVLLVRNDVQLPSPLASTPDSAYKRLTAGVQNMEQQKFDAAEQQFRGALQLMPHLRTGCNLLSRAQAAQGKKAEAQQTLEGCLQYFPDKTKVDRVAELQGP